MNDRCIPIVSMAAILLAVTPAFALDAREPLGYQNAAIYGGIDSQYLRDPNEPMDFAIIQAVIYEGQSSADWAAWLASARSAGKRVIANLIPQASDGNGGWYGVANNAGTLTDVQLNKLADISQTFFDEVGADELYGVTIGEEHIFWNGQREILNAMYDKIKARQDVPVFQWYSPASEGTAPGLNGWYNLKSDGWVSDEYFLDAPHMERNMRQYTIMQKPHVNIIFAGGPGNTSVPFIQERFDGQVAVHQKYDIPMGFFTWSGIIGAGSGQDPTVDPVTRARFMEVLDAVENSRLVGPDPRSTWDTVPWTIPTIALETQPGSNVATYREDYINDRVIRVVNDTAITGFQHLRWDSSAVELRPREAGPASSSVTYTFETPQSFSYALVRAPAFETLGTDAAITMSIYNGNGTLIQSIPLNNNNPLRVGVSGADIADGKFKVTYTLTGTASAPGQVLAGVNSISVDSLLGTRPFYGMHEAIDFSDANQQSKWTTSLGLGTGPQGPQFNPSTAVYNPLTNAFDTVNTSELRITPENATTNGKGDITLVRQVNADPGELFAWPVFQADAVGYSSWGTSVQLWLSTDGVNWDVASNVAQFGSATQHLIADATGLASYESLSTFWLKIRMYDIYGLGHPDYDYVHAWNFTLDALTTLEPVSIPEPSSATVAFTTIIISLVGRRQSRTRLAARSTINRF